MLEEEKHLKLTASEEPQRGSATTTSLTEGQLQGTGTWPGGATATPDSHGTPCAPLPKTYCTSAAFTAVCSGVCECCCPSSSATQFFLNRLSSLISQLPSGDFSPLDPLIKPSRSNLSHQSNSSSFCLLPSLLAYHAALCLNHLLEQRLDSFSSQHLACSRVPISFSAVILTHSHAGRLPLPSSQPLPSSLCWEFLGSKAFLCPTCSAHTGSVLLQKGVQFLIAKRRVLAFSHAEKSHACRTGNAFVIDLESENQTHPWHNFLEAPGLTIRTEPGFIHPKQMDRLFFATLSLLWR